MITTITRPMPTARGVIPLDTCCRSGAGSPVSFLAGAAEPSLIFPYLCLSVGGRDVFEGVPEADFVEETADAAAEVEVAGRAGIDVCSRGIRNDGQRLAGRRIDEQVEGVVPGLGPGPIRDPYDQECRLAGNHWYGRIHAVAATGVLQAIEVAAATLADGDTAEDELEIGERRAGVQGIQRLYQIADKEYLSGTDRSCGEFTGMADRMVRGGHQRVAGGGEPAEREASGGDNAAGISLSILIPGAPPVARSTVLVQNWSADRVCEAVREEGRPHWDDRQRDGLALARFGLGHGDLRASGLDARHIAVLVDGGEGRVGY